MSFLNKWEAWGSAPGMPGFEMESRIIYCSQHPACALQFRISGHGEPGAGKKQGLPNPVAHTDMAIRVAVEAIRKLIKEDNE